MPAILWRDSLRRLQEQFNKLADSGATLGTYLADETMPSAGSMALYVPQFNTPHVAVSNDPDHCPMQKPAKEDDPRATATVLLDGRPARVIPGTFRRLWMFGDQPAALRFPSIAKAAWQTLASDGETLIKFPTGTRSGHMSGHEDRQWVYAVFDLAWREIPGSPLRAEPFITEMVNGAKCNVKLADVSDVQRGMTVPGMEPLAAGLLRNASRWLESIALPPPFVYAQIDNIIVASAQAIDILLAEDQPAVQPQSSAAAKRKTTGKRLKDKPLTDAQREAAEMLTKCKGNKTEAAKRLDISRQALDDRLEGIKLRGELAQARSVKTHALPTDERGQVTTLRGRGRR